MWNKITGRIIYENGWYARCELPKALGFYLRKLAWMQKKSLRLMQPEGGTHITFVKRENPPNKEFWKKYDKMSCDVLYNIEAGGNRDAYYWLDIKSEFIDFIRKELGLPPQARYPIHLTYGIDCDFIEKRVTNYGPSGKNR